MSIIHAVVTDLDGTIVDENGHISATTLLAAACLAHRRIPLIIATARSPDWIIRRSDLVPWVTDAVCCDGGIGWSAKTNEILWRETISQDLVERIVRSIKDTLPTAGIASYDGHHWKVTKTFLRHRPRPPGAVKIVAAENIANEPVYTMWVSRPDGEAVELPRDLSDLQPLLAVTELPYNLVGIGPTGFDKAVGLTRVFDDIGIDPAHAIAFGDMLNDLPVFALCGQSVAVANAHPDVIMAASIIAPCVHNDGFARTLCDLGVVSREFVLADWNDPGCNCRFVPREPQGSPPSV
jgi:hydroxymethylpyrimidine pyrophosphatase-like HAD family hydrolase